MNEKHLAISDRIIEAVNRRLQIGLDMSTCTKRPMSAVLWLPRTVFVMGTNGPPEGFEEYCKPCPRKDSPSGVDMEICPAVHGELAAILNAGRQGIPTHGGVLFISCRLPCKDCMKEIIKSGIQYIVSPYSLEQFKQADMFHDAKVYNFKLAREMMEQCGVQYVHDPRLIGGTKQ